MAAIDRAWRRRPRAEPVREATRAPVRAWNDRMYITGWEIVLDPRTTVGVDLGRPDPASKFIPGVKDWTGTIKWSGVVEVEEVLAVCGKPKS